MKYSLPSACHPRVGAVNEHMGKAAAARADQLRHDLGHAVSPLGDLATLIDGVLEDIFATLREGAREAERLWNRVAVDGTVSTTDLAALRPGIEARLSRNPHYDGSGLVVNPKTLRDGERCQEWWRPSPHGGYEFLDVKTGFDQLPYDYTAISWFVGAARGLESIRRPYLDLAGTDLYMLTFAVPANVAGLFIGASGANITVAGFEELVLSELASFGSEAVLVNPDSRVVVSSSPDFSAGERMLAPSQASVPVAVPARPGASTGSDKRKALAPMKVHPSDAADSPHQNGRRELILCSGRHLRALPLRSGRNQLRRHIFHGRRGRFTYDLGLLFKVCAACCVSEACRQRRCAEQRDHRLGLPACPMPSHHRAASPHPRHSRRCMTTTTSSARSGSAGPCPTTTKPAQSTASPRRGCALTPSG